MSGSTVEPDEKNHKEIASQQNQGEELFTKWTSRK